jgi:hypothetical protein
MLESFRNTPTWLRMGLEWAAGIAAWLGGFELVKIFISDVTSRSIAAQIYVVISAVGLAIALFVREWFTSRKEKYANITNYLQQANQIARELHTYIQEQQPAANAPRNQQDAFFEVCKSKLGQVLDQVNLVFVSITGTNCRTSIKLTYAVGNETYYYTLARDQGSLQKCLETDNKRVRENHDPLKKNRQFLLLFDDTNNVWRYFSNNLMKDNNFTSTSFSAYDSTWGETGSSPKRWTLRGRKEEWPLPYRSTIACAIRHGPAPFVAAKKSIVLGFITVDSESRGVFEERWDVPIMFAIADAIYHPLKTYLEIQNRATG